MTDDERTLVLEAVCEACLTAEVAGLTPAQRTDMANLVRREVARRLLIPVVANDNLGDSNLGWFCPDCSTHHANTTASCPRRVAPLPTGP